MKRLINKEKIAILVPFIFLTLLVLSPSVFAAANMEVTAASCNPDEVEVGDQFSCTVTVQNTGDVSGTLNTATLFPDSSNWLESASYATTVSATIGSGASTEVTFSGLQGTKSGDNGFARIMLDDVTDTFISDNSITVNSISVVIIATEAASSADEDETVDITGQATVGGNVDVTLTFSGCDIGNQEASVTTNGLTDGQTSSHTWEMTMGSSDCSYTISAEANSNPSGTASATDSDSGTIDCSDCSSSSTTTSSSSSGGGDSGGGGGGGGPGAITTDSKIEEEPLDIGDDSQSDEKNDEESADTEDAAGDEGMVDSILTGASNLASQAVAFLNHEKVKAMLPALIGLMIVLVILIVYINLRHKRLEE